MIDHTFQFRTDETSKVIGSRELGEGRWGRGTWRLVSCREHWLRIQTGKHFRFGPNSLGDSRRLCMGFSVLGCKMKTASIPGWHGYTSPSFLGLWTSQWTNKLQLGDCANQYDEVGSLNCFLSIKAVHFVESTLHKLMQMEPLLDTQSIVVELQSFLPFWPLDCWRGQRRVGIRSCDWAHPKVAL